MVYENINSKVFIGRLDANFNLDYSQPHALIAEWVAQAIGLLKVPVYLEKARACVPVANYRAKLPCHIKLIEAIYYNGTRLERIDHVINAKSSCDNENIEYNFYEVLGDSYISTTFEETEEDKPLIIYYTRMRVEYDEDTKVYYPLIPDAEPLLDALDYFILMRILQRGHKHPTMNLETNNEFLNPGLAWKIKKKAARNAFSVIDADTRQQISIILKAFVLNPEAYYNQFFITNGN